MFFTSLTFSSSDYLLIVSRCFFPSKVFSRVLFCTTTRLDISEKISKTLNEDRTNFRPAFHKQGRRRERQPRLQAEKESSASVLQNRSPSTSIDNFRGAELIIVGLPLFAGNR